LRQEGYLTAWDNFILAKGVTEMSERVVTVGGSQATRPLSDFGLVTDYQGPKAGTYYVDLNVAATGNGSPDHPFATIAEAITASNTSIGLTANRWWARRNRIYVCGDGISEDLTILPEKCDVIGCGSDLYPFPRVIGHHEIALAKVGCRFINMGFQCDDATLLFSLPISSHGFQILGGLMTPKSGGTGTAILTVDTACIVIDGVKIQPNGGGGVFAEGLSIDGTIGHEITIKNCDIYATEGIHVASGNATTGGIIDNNTIYATALTINDESSLFRVTRNQLITAANPTNAGTGGIVANKLLAAGNKLTGSSTVQNADYPFVIAMAS
jgi:hypothetical protein